MKLNTNILFGVVLLAFSVYSSIGTADENTKLVISSDNVHFTGDGIFSYLSSKIEKLEEDHAPKRNFLENELAIINKENTFSPDFVQYVKNVNLVFIGHFVYLSSGNEIESTVTRRIQKWFKQNPPTISGNTIEIPYMSGGARYYRLGEAIQLLQHYYSVQTPISIQALQPQ